MKKKSLAVRIKQLSKKVVSLFNVVLCGFILSINSVYAQGSNTSSIDGFITFVCDWSYSSQTNWLKILDMPCLARISNFSTSALSSISKYENNALT